MTTSRQFADSEGTSSEWRDHPMRCTRVVNGAPCNHPVRVRTWESHDGAYEDYQYLCSDGHRWWIDGDDG